MRRLLYRPTPAGHRALLRPMLSHAALGSPALPAVVDLRSQLLPIRDQGQEGSCSGFATAALREQDIFRVTDAKPSEYFAPAYCYAKARQIEGTFPQDLGATMGDEILGLEQSGICPESLLPYDQDPAEAPTPAADSAAAAFKIASGTPIDLSSVDNLRAVLAGGRAISFGMRLHRSFEVGTGSDGRIPTPGFNDPVLGGHGMLLCGYDDETKYLVLRNSWGATAWGDTKNGQGGYGYLPYSMIGDICEAWAVWIQPPPQAKP